MIICTRCKQREGSWWDYNCSYCRNKPTDAIAAAEYEKVNNSKDIIEMGFFSKYNNTEKGLLELYSQLFSEMGLPDSHNTAEDLLDRAIVASKKAGRYELNDMGTTLLEQEKSSGQVNQNFENKRKEGVSDEDILWWYNLNDIERMMMVEMDELNKTTLYLHELQEGSDTEKAMKKVSKYHPVYGDFNDETHGRGDDRPLPYELKDRINIYIQNRANEYSENYKNDLERSSSFNALIRNEMRAGKL